MRDFRKYEVWQVAHSLVLELYKATNTFSNHEIYGLTSQLRRAATSIPTNISEGCGRSTDADFARFIHIALGSAHEVEYLLQLAFDVNYLPEKAYNNFNDIINTIKRKLFQLNKTLLQSRL